jgi:hypothetical protein
MVAEWLDPRKERVTAFAVSRNGLVAAERAIAVDLRRQHEHDRDRRCLTGLIDAIDAILDDLEHLHLLDLHRVPAAYTTRLERLTARLPADVRCELRTGTPIARLMESLYTIQGKLMTRRSGRTGEAGRDDAATRSSYSGSVWSALL